MNSENLKSIIYISKRCPHCRKLLLLLQSKPDLVGSIQVTCIDDEPFPNVIKSVPAMIFDEVDTGIGGATADAVGQRLKILGDKSQVLVITHQPQVAAKASLNLKVFKNQAHDSTTTSVVKLSDQEKLDEIARMLSGSEVTEEARVAAQKLIA